MRVVRFYVRHFSSSSSSSSFLSFFFLLCNPVRSVFRAGPQRRVCEISVPRRTSTASLRDQCAAPDLNREFARSVFRAGPQPRVCEISVACRTSTASLRDQCCVPDLNRESARSVLRAGPQPRVCEISVACRTSTGSCEFSVMAGPQQKICQKDMSERISEDMSERMSKDMSERMRCTKRLLCPKALAFYCRPNKLEEQVNCLRAGSCKGGSTVRASLRMLRQPWQLWSMRLVKTRTLFTSVLVVNGLHPCSKLYNMHKMTSCETD